MPLRIGMTEAQFLVCSDYRGARPDAVNTTTTAGGVRKQYVFQLLDMHHYVYFTNGVLTAIQQ